MNSILVANECKPAENKQIYICDLLRDDHYNSVQTTIPLRIQLDEQIKEETYRIGSYCGVMRERAGIPSIASTVHVIFTENSTSTGFHMTCKNNIIHQKRRIVP